MVASDALVFSPETRAVGSILGDRYKVFMVDLSREIFWFRSGALLRRIFLGASQRSERFLQGWPVG